MKNLEKEIKRCKIELDGDSRRLERHIEGKTRTERYNLETLQQKVTARSEKLEALQARQEELKTAVAEAEACLRGKWAGLFW